nr:MAG TPA: hypothetical protein [Caudoviricetes sp.]
MYANYSSPFFLFNYSLLDFNSCVKHLFEFISFFFVIYSKLLDFYSILLYY